MGKKKRKLVERQSSQNTSKYRPVSMDPTFDIADHKDSLPEAATGEWIDLSEFDKFREISKNRDELYNFFDEMSKDTIISTALEMYAEDCTSYNDHGKIIWVESDDPNVQRAAQRLIDVLKIEDDCFYHILSLVTYGDVYLENFYEENENKKYDANSGEILNERVIVNQVPEDAKLKEYIELHPNPAELFDLSKEGKTLGFVKTRNLTPYNKKDEQERYQSIYYKYNTSDVDIYPPTKYVHISLRKAADRYPEKVILSRDKEVKDDNAYEFSVVRGKSILYDVYKVYQELSLLEDSLILNRLLKSAIVRMFQIEVGDMPRKEVNNLLRRVKNMIDHKTSMNTQTGTFRSYISTHPVENNIYVPTKNGKGSINPTTVGGDVDVKNIVDIEYYRDKLSGGLRIPKQYLGLTDDATGFNGGSSLAKIDSRYARTIKRIQTAYISGITTLINIHFMSKGFKKYVNNFQVRMNSPSAIEDQERAEILQTNVGIVSDIINLIDSLNIDELSKFKIKKILINDKLAMPDVDEILAQCEKDMEENPEDTPTEEGEEDLVSSDDVFSGGGGGSGSSDFDSDTETPEGEDSEFPEDLSDEEVDLSDNDAVDKALGDEEA